MLKLALSDLSDWRFRSIRFRTELTSPAPCALAVVGALIMKAQTSTADKILRGTNLFIKLLKKSRYAGIII